MSDLEKQKIQLAKFLADSWGYDWECPDKSEPGECMPDGACLDCCWESEGSDNRQSFINLAADVLKKYSLEEHSKKK